MQFYDYDPVMKLSDYNRLLKLRNMNTVELTEDEYFLVTDSQLLYKVEDNADMQTIQFANKELRLKGIDTKSFWYSMNNTGIFTVFVPD